MDDRDESYGIPIITADCDGHYTATERGKKPIFRGTIKVDTFDRETFDLIRKFVEHQIEVIDTSNKVME